MYRTPYHAHLSREAELMVRGRQAFVRDAAALWTRLMARLGIGSAEARVADARHR